jgi:sulfur relay (sulfurtransferase) complex TusBCD TusD component (DsrE family)
MMIAILLKSGPGTGEADRALQTTADMLAQGHTVSLFLMQEAVRFCHPGKTSLDAIELRKLIEENLTVHFLMRDAELRGIKASDAGVKFLGGPYESVIDLMESCDRVVGIL